jgi:hypothetical protein
MARRLIAHEAARAHRPDGSANSAVRVLEQLHGRLSKLMGSVGFSALLSRALSLAKAEVPSLEAVQVGEDGSLQGFDQDEQDEDPETAANRNVILVAHLLGLLVTFIGAPLTLRLLRDAWPEAPMDRIELTNQERP